MELVFISSVFVTLFVVVDPLGLIPTFITYLAGYTPKKRRYIIIKSILVSTAVSILFLLLGKYLLQALGISRGAFLIAGGALLFLISMEMLYGEPSHIKMRNYEVKEIEKTEDVSVFPLAIPMLSGPGTIASLVMFDTQSDGDLTKKLALIIITISIFLIAGFFMFLSTKIGEIIGDTGVAIIQRLNGLLLSALSVQFIINGLTTLKII